MPRNREDRRLLLGANHQEGFEHISQETLPYFRRRAIQDAAMPRSPNRFRLPDARKQQRVRPILDLGCCLRPPIREQTHSLTVDWVVQFFPPTSLTRCGNRHAYIELIRLFFEYTIDLPTFSLLARLFYRAFAAGTGTPPIEYAIMVFQQIPSLLTGPIVNVKEPFSPEKLSASPRGLNLTILQQRTRLTCSSVEIGRVSNIR